MKETYTIRVFLNDKLYGVATTFCEENAKTFIKTVDKNMNEDGYRRIGYTKVRIDKRRITTIKLAYTKV